MSPTHLRKLLAALSLGAASLLVLPAAAQTATPAPTDKTTDTKKVVVEEKKADQPKDGTLQLEKMEVTGSRIRTLVGEQTALPVFTLTQADLEQRGVTRLADIRRAIPQLGGSVGFNDNLINGGVSRAQQVSTSFDLRGLGGNSTLVLVDGRRVPRTGQEAPGGAGGREDFNVDGIPVSAIERVEVLSQSAGAIYGSEGIAGVINIVLKKNFSGSELNITYDNTFDSDVAQTTVSLTAGYRKGKLTTFVTASYEHQNGLASRDRWFSAKSAFPEFGGSTTFLAQQPANGAGSLSSTSSPQNGGASLPGLTTNYVLLPAGSNGTTAANSAYVIGTAVPQDPAAYSMLIDPANRRSIVFKADYEFAKWLKPYVEARWSRFDNFTYGTPITLTSTSLPVGYTGNPFAGAVILRKVFYDLPVLHTDSLQENLSLTFGLRGDFFGDWRYDAAASYAGNTARDNPVSAAFNSTLLSAAINNVDPTKRPILAYDSSKISDPNAAGLLDALRPLYPHKDVSEVYDYTFQADGTVWDGWAGAMKLALGGEAQDENVKFHRTPGDSSLSFVLTKPFSRRTTAAFAEASVPLLSDKQHLPLVHRLEVGAAVRSEDYSDIGSQTSPSYHALYQPFSWITVRASKAEGFKAPKLYDLLAPITTSTSTLTVASNVHDTLRGGELVLGTINTVSGGNPALAPETSTSKNWGVVVDIPGKWFKGLSFSIDHYALNYVNRISSASRQVTIDFFPERVTRAAPSAADLAAGYAGVITGMDTSNINLSGVRTRGWDYQVTYQRSTGWGAFSLNFAYSTPGKTITTATPVAVPRAGFQSDRFSSSLFWSRAAWSAGVVVNYQSKYYIGGPITSVPYPSVIDWNPQVAYDFGKSPRFNDKTGAWWSHLLADSKVTLTIINALDRDPSSSEVASGRIVMDARLRRYILSLRKKF